MNEEELKRIKEFNRRKIENITMSEAIDATSRLWVSTGRNWLGDGEAFMNDVKKTYDIFMKARG